MNDDGPTMESDRKLLELAAKAAEYGETVYFSAGQDNDPPTPYFRCKNIASRWNPLTDDGDALRLAVKLGLDIQRTNRLNNIEGNCTKIRIRDYSKHYLSGHRFVEEDVRDDHYAATRRAIVRAAAEIGRRK
jgi:hypothetical protein